MSETRPFRLPQGGRLIDRAWQLPFRFDGRHLRGVIGDTIASALLANGQMLMGRSFKYHRPRGPMASGAEEPNALLGLGQGGRFEPNQRATGVGHDPAQPELLALAGGRSDVGQ